MQLVFPFARGIILRLRANSGKKRKKAAFCRAQPLPKPAAAEQARRTERENRADPPCAAGIPARTTHRLPAQARKIFKPAARFCGRRAQGFREPFLREVERSFPSFRALRGSSVGISSLCHPEPAEGSLSEYRQDLNRDPSKARVVLPCLQGVKRARRNRRCMGACPWQLVAESVSFSADYCAALRAVPLRMTRKGVSFRLE